MILGFAQAKRESEDYDFFPHLSVSFLRYINANPDFFHQTRKFLSIQKTIFNKKENKIKKKELSHLILQRPQGNSDAQGASPGQTSHLLGLGFPISPQFLPHPHQKAENSATSS